MIERCATTLANARKNVRECSANDELGMAYASTLKTLDGLVGRRPENEAAIPVANDSADETRASQAG